MDVGAQKSQLVCGALHILLYDGDPAFICDGLFPVHLYCDFFTYVTNKSHFVPCSRKDSSSRPLNLSPLPYPPRILFY